jgi:hypothetical protein
MGAIGAISSHFAHGAIAIVPIRPVPTNSSAKATQKPFADIRARAASLLRICNPSRVDIPAESLANFIDFSAAFAEFGGAERLA